MIYKKDYLKEISFPLGGIGSGSVGLAGNGSLVDWEIFNRPSKGSLNGYSHIAVKVIKNGEVFSKVLNSDLNKDLTGNLGQQSWFGFGHGPNEHTMRGFPHFKNCEFNGEFPIAELKFTDDEFPGEVHLTAFNPFIPLDSKNSSIPSAFFEISYKNPTNCKIEFQSIFSLSNPYTNSIHTKKDNGSFTSIKLKNSGVPESSVEYGDLSISCENPDIIQQYWYRGASSIDHIKMFWYEFSKNKEMKNRVYDEAGTENKYGIHDAASIGKTIILNPGEAAKIRFVLSWNVPRTYEYLTNSPEAPETRCWKNYYATVFRDSVESGVYSLKNWEYLYGKTVEFKNELFASTVEDIIKDAISSTISVLKSPTVLRLENGEFYGFEGCHTTKGSCRGTCQHVYNYAYALCFLFPDLERTIRDLEFKYETNEFGGTFFRLGLPLGTESIEKRSCVDGQMGMVIKTYREWKISGDNQWLKSIWDDVKKVLEYAWHPKNPHRWDLNKDGVMEGRQHHTLDTELFGPSAWLQGFYLAALKAASEMAEFLGDNDKQKEYRELYEKGKKWTTENLFNGEYFFHKIDLNDKSIPKSFDCADIYWDDELNEITKQIGEGSSIDQLTGQWHATLCGLGNIFDLEQTNKALKSMYKYNFKKSMREVTNFGRIFAANDECGTIMCDYPDGTYEPRMPIGYCEECMTGFEYQFAGMLLSRGFKDEALNVIKAVRDRYDGKKRNPWNEIECGSNYARSMASFALLPIISGFYFDLPHNTIGFNPLYDTDDFKCIWSLGTGWGNIEINKSFIRLNIKSGSLALSQIKLPFVKFAKRMEIDGKELTFELKNGNFIFEKTNINSYLEIQV